MLKIGLVILNFLTYCDTLESLFSFKKSCVESLSISVYVVDNKSDPIKLEKFVDDVTRLDLVVKIISESENLGFSKGMNLGIRAALNDNCDFIACANNDIIYPAKFSFQPFMKIFEENEKIGVIGPKILNNQGLNQNPYLIKKEKKSRLFYILIYSNILGRLFYFLKGYLTSFFSVRSRGSQNLPTGCYYALHGAFFVLTPSYLRLFKNLDPGTFLFCEELILAERNYQNKLFMYYTNDVCVLHKEDSATNFMFCNNSFKKINFILNENYKSYRYFLKKYIFKS
jgi:GT2 family glycosyltransferase